MRVSAVEVEAEAAPPTPSDPAAAAEPAAADASAGDKREPRAARGNKKPGGRPRRNVTLKLEDIVVGQELPGTVVSLVASRGEGRRIGRAKPASAGGGPGGRVARPAASVFGRRRGAPGGRSGWAGGGPGALCRRPSAH